MRILITGGTGFIGSQLALNSLEKGHSVRVLGQKNTEAESQNMSLIQEKGAEVVLGSVTEKGVVSDILKEIDVVFHLAAAQHEMNVPDKRYWDVNVAGTKNMLEASINAGVKRFVHGSTIGVYGSALEGNIDENSTLKPSNIYGRTKLEAEKWCCLSRINFLFQSSVSRKHTGRETGGFLNFLRRSRKRYSLSLEMGVTYII